MDSHQATKRSIDENSLQNQDDSMSSVNEEGGDGAETKRFKQELHPLQMANMMEKILSFLDVESIKQARQVKNLWGVEGAKLLISKCYIKIPPELQTEDLSSKSKEMDNFKAFLSCRSSETSMISNITIETVDDYILWKSLGVLGQQVKSVKFKFMDDAALLLRNIFCRLPNLNHLNVDDVNLCNRGAVIAKAVVSEMSKKEKDGKKLLISKIFWSESVEQLEAMEEFANCNNILLECLYLAVDHNWLRAAPDRKARLVNTLTNLLNKKRGTLNKLILCHCQLYLPLLEFPCMTKLTEMSLVFTPRAADLPQCKFPPSFRFSEMVPNLEKFSINYHGVEGIADGRDFYKDLFEKTGTAPTVKRLECGYNYFDLATEPLLQNFPNIEELETNFFQGSKFFRSLWTHGVTANLKKLHLCIKLNGFFDDLDCSFTGFSPRTVAKIKNAPNLDPYTMEELEVLRAYPSILNLKELEQLTITFAKPPFCLPNRLLAISGKYAFKMLPKNPKVFIQARTGGNLNYDGLMASLDEVSKLPNVVVEYVGYN